MGLPYRRFVSTEVLSMKKNILLITIVTAISLAIIAAVIIINAGKAGDSSLPDSSVPLSTPSSMTTPEPQTEPVQTTPPATEPPAEETHETQTEPATTPEAAGIISLAQSLIGIDFADGGDSPDAGFDNSGFIYYVLRENGFITCPRGVAMQAEMGTERGYDELRAGDLVYFMNDEGTGAGFGGIYIGNGTMIACLMPGTSVKEVSITNDYYRGNFYRGVGLS